MRELDGSDLAHTPVPILPGGEHTLPGGRHFVRPFRTVHPVPSQGYCVFSRKAKLKAEYAGLPVRWLRWWRQRRGCVYVGFVAASVSRASGRRSGRLLEVVLLGGAFDAFLRPPLAGV